MVCAEDPWLPTCARSSRLLRRPDGRRLVVWAPASAGSGSAPPALAPTTCDGWSWAARHRPFVGCDPRWMPGPGHDGLDRVALREAGAVILRRGSSRTSRWSCARPPPWFRLHQRARRLPGAGRPVVACFPTSTRSPLTPGSCTTWTTCCRARSAATWRGSGRLESCFDQPTADQLAERAGSRPAARLPRRPLRRRRGAPRAGDLPADRNVARGRLTGQASTYWRRIRSTSRQPERSSVWANARRPHVVGDRAAAPARRTPPRGRRRARRRSWRPDLASTPRAGSGRPRLHVSSPARRPERCSSGRPVSRKSTASSASSVTTASATRSTTDGSGTLRADRPHAPAGERLGQAAGSVDGSLADAEDRVVTAAPRGQPLALGVAEGPGRPPGARPEHEQPPAGQPVTQRLLSVAQVVGQGLESRVTRSCRGSPVSQSWWRPSGVAAALASASARLAASMACRRR